MLSVDYRHHCLQLTEALGANGEATKALDLLAVHHAGVAAQLEQMLGANDRNVINSQADAARHHLHSLPTVIADVSWRGVFRQAETWHDGLMSFIAFEIEQSAESVSHIAAAGLVESIEQFLVAGDAYTSGFSGERAWQLLVAAVQTQRAIADAMAWLNLATDAARAPEPQGGQGALEIALYGPGDVDALLRRVAALKGLYSELCQLLNVNEVEQPLVLLKLETGSLYAKIQGAIPVLVLMDKYLCAAVSYLHRRFTLEGKLQSVPKSTESLQSLVDLRAQLIAQGIPTADLDTELQRAAAQIGRYLNDLLQHQGRVAVNGQLMSVGDRTAVQQLERREPLLLPSTGAGAPGAMPDPPDAVSN